MNSTCDGDILEKIAQKIKLSLTVKGAEHLYQMSQYLWEIFLGKKLFVKEISAAKQSFNTSAKCLFIFCFLLWFECILRVFNLHPEVLQFNLQHSCRDEDKKTRKWIVEKMSVRGIILFLYLPRVDWPDKRFTWNKAPLTAARVLLKNAYGGMKLYFLMKLRGYTLTVWHNVFICFCLCLHVYLAVIYVLTVNNRTWGQTERAGCSLGSEWKWQWCRMKQIGFEFWTQSRLFPEEDVKSRLQC